MRHFFLAVIMAGSCSSSSGQRTQLQANWQQRVEYKINVSLDDVDHRLNGNIQFRYFNNSPNELREMYIHLWPNGYRDHTTDFARQQLLNGKTEFYFSDVSEKGGISELNFTVDGNKVQWSLLEGQPDICKLTLNAPIPSFGSVLISTPFVVNIPGSFSRFGHVGQDYQITQWYPKPAVYDVNGWNPLAYLDQGEFYSEFGRFEVKITVPENYVVAATGVLQEESEWKFIRNRRDNPISDFGTIQSASATKTLTFIQDSIHDFAWFASKDFNVEESQVKLANGHVVKTFVYAPDTELSSTKHIATALNYYSEHCGPYPYQYCSVVEGPIQAGGGMEYPMITVVSDLGEEVIVHEVGHNWFYGMLANHEGEYPWMDESINTYFESKAMHGNNYTASLDRKRFNLEQISDQSMSYLANLADRIKMNQAVGLGSKYFSGTNYGLMVYGKGSKMFGHLHAYIGEQVFFDCFKAYYERWAFKHPLPGDMKAVFEEVSELNLGWFFDEMLQSDGKLDYRIESLTSSHVMIENNGSVSVPYPVGFYKEGELKLEVWQEGHYGVSGIPLPDGFAFDLIKIDPYEILTEENRQNNSIRKTGIGKKIEPMKLSFLRIYENPNESNLYFMPFVAWNKYSNWSLGTVLTNNTMPQPNFRIMATPMFSPSTGDVSGYANFSYRWYQNTTLQKIEIGANNARFAYQPFESYMYNRLAPYLQFSFRNADKRMPDKTNVTLRYTHTSFNPNFDQDEAIEVLVADTQSWNRRSVVENSPDQFIDLIIERSNNKALNPFSFRLNVQYGLDQDNIHVYDSLISGIRQDLTQDDFIRLNLTLNKRINYALDKKGLDIRIFVGTYLKESQSGRYHYRIGSQSGRYDYTFEKTVMGRNAEEGLFQRQILNTDMNLKQVGNFGNILGWTASANLKSGLPGKLPLQLYLDLFTFKDIDQVANNGKGDKFGYSGGLCVNLLPNFLEIYVPFFSNQFITETQKFQGIENFGQRITFMLDLNTIGNFSLEEMLNQVF